jgi:hypothetical protein
MVIATDDGSLGLRARHVDVRSRIAGPNNDYAERGHSLQEFAPSPERMARQIVPIVERVNGNSIGVVTSM